MSESTPAATPVRLLSAVPTFAVDNVGETARWYAEHLGFRTAGHFPAAEPYAYASLQRDGAEIMLLRQEGYQKPDRPEGAWDAYIRMQGVAALYRLVEGRDFIRTPLKKQPYGDWEFEVLDPNGYLLVFGGDVDL
jgi:uncharacterized glyoxalase superfamily protein PhnB